MLESVLGVIRYIVDNPSNEGQKLRRLAYAAAWQIYKRTVGLPLIVTLENGLRYIAEPRSSNATGVIYTRLYEPEYTLFLRRHIQRCGSMIDVGAHTGLFTLLFADLIEEGACFEPSPDTFELLQRNLRINNLTSHNAIMAAASNREGTAGFLITDTFGGRNRLDSSSNSVVSVVSVDACMRDKPLSAPLTLFKVDVEGEELPVLEGARGTLSRASGALALVENNRSGQIQAFFDTLGWKVFAIDKKGKIDCSKGAKEKAYNLLACGPDHALWSEVRV